MPKDKFFSQDKCDRCGSDLVVRIMSWFTDETICMDCSAKEDALKLRLRETGSDPANLEGCGYVPEEQGQT